MAYYNYATDSIYTIPVSDQLAKLNYFYIYDFTFDEGDTLYVSVFNEGYLKIPPPAYNIQIQYRYTKRENYFYVKRIGKNNMVYGSSFPDTVRRDFFTKFRRPIKTDLFSLRNLDSPDPESSELGFTGANSHLNCFLDYDSCYICSGDYDIIRMCGNTKTFLYQEKIPDFKSQIIFISKDRENRLWVNARNKGARVFKGLDVKQPLYHFLDGFSVSSVCQDSDDGYWLSTLENGIYYMPSMRFNYLDRNSGLFSNKVHSLAFVNDRLYFSTADNSLSCLDANSGKLINTKKMNFPVANLASDGSNLIVCDALSFSIRPNGERIYFSFTFEGTKRNLRVKRAIDYNADFFLGFTNVEVFLLNKHTGKMGITLAEGLPRVFSVHKQNSTVWIGTKSGLYSYNHKKLRFYGHDTSLLTARIEDITSVGDTLFLATRGYGLLCMVNHKVIKQFTEADGLPSNMTRCIAIGENNTLWVGTNRGLCRLKKHGKEFVISSLNALNGLISNEVNHVIERHKKLYVATTGGLEILDINDFYNSASQIPVYIEALRINNRMVPVKQQQQLPYDQNFVSIAYKGISVRSEGQVKYIYKLEGLDTGWTYTKNIYVQYTTLPPGNYRFVVYAINDDGEMSSYPATLAFAIQKPFWLRWWFVLLVTFSASVIVYVLYKNRIRQIKKREEDKAALSRQIAESELKALRAQMNPHFMFNAINSIQNFVLKNDSTSAQKYLTKFARLIRSVLENSKHEMVQLSKEIEALQLYMELEALRASFGFDYELVLEESVNSKQIYIPPMMIQPYIENAIIHGIVPLTARRGNLSVKFRQSDSVLICTIDDNGIGRAGAEEIKLRKQLSHESMGMEVTNSRIDILNTHWHTLSVQVVVNDKFNNGEPAGTTIEITMNIKKPIP